MLYSDLSAVTSKSDRHRVVVIGSGAIGLHVASALATRGLHVVVIEAGDTHLGGFASESFRSVGRQHHGIRVARGRTLGGTTTLWGGQLVEFQPVDINGRDWLPGSKWPVTYEEVAPYFKPTYEHLGVDLRLQDDEQVWRGIASRRPELGPEFEVFLTRWLRVPNCAQIFADQIRGDPKLAVIIGHTAVGFRGTGDQIDAVRVLDQNGISHWLEGDRFTLAVGTIENARLLLHAARDRDWACPWRDNQNIGRYFQDHLGGRIGPFHPNDKRAFYDMFGTIVYSGFRFQPKIRRTNDVLARQRTLNNQGYFAFESKASEHLVYLKQFLKAAVFGRRLTGLGDLFRHGMGGMRYLVPLMWRYILDHRVFVPGSAQVYLLVQAEQMSCAESRVTIDSTALDSFGLPRVVLDWRIGEHELASIRDFAIRMRETLHSAGIGHLEIDPDLLTMNPSYLSKLADTAHQAGGTVMGTSEQDGVVDRNLRVFGTRNLYIGGASVFPTASSANITFTALALATRLIDHLAG